MVLLPVTNTSAINGDNIIETVVIVVSSDYPFELLVYDLLANHFN